MQIRHLFEGAEGKVLARNGLLAVTGLVVAAFADSPLVLEISRYYVALPRLVEHLGVAMVVAAVVILMIEIGLRKEMLADIEEIFRKQQPSQYLASFHLRRTDYDERITADIKRARPADVIDVIGISQRNMFDDYPGVRELEQKVRDGCHFRFLLLHPDSAIVDSIENMSKHFGFPDLRSSLLNTVSGPVDQLLTLLSNRRTYKGSLEIRLHRDLFSTVAYYSSPRLTVVGLYLAHAGGTLCPAFEIARDGELLPVTSQHFESMWTQCSGNVLVSVTARTSSNNVANVFAQLSTKSRAQS